MMFNANQFYSEVGVFHQTLDAKILEIENLIAIATDHCKKETTPLEEVVLLSTMAYQTQQKLELFKQHKNTWSDLIKENEQPLSQDEQTKMASAAVNARVTFGELARLRIDLNQYLLELSRNHEQTGQINTTL